jgi:uncharacterized protein YjbJ (UPF0337 family)
LRARSPRGVFLAGCSLLGAALANNESRSCERDEPVNRNFARDWKQFSGKVKEQWGKLTDDELAQSNGNHEQLEGKIQAKYGYAKDKAKQEVDDWCNRTK